ncbi:MAG: signal recognition particle-docking protein FtsY [Longimicrobiales bacterium]
MNRLTKREGEKPSLWQKIKNIAFTDVGVLMRGLDQGSLEKIEEILLAADFGVPATLGLVDHVERLSRLGKIRSEREFSASLEQEITRILTAGNADPALQFNPTGLTVILMVGVNGVGKTTTIGKLARRLREHRRKVLLAAGDTFRAGAIDQLGVWAQRAGAEFVGAAPGADPASVAFDALDAAAARGCDTVVVDTAGRLHTQNDLMIELSKVARVIGRKLDGAPQETLIVLDATVGQNAVAQVRTFRQALPLTGIALAKLDSSARGGIVVALKQEFDVPVKLVGTGEGIDDLEAFDAARFAREVLAA